MGKFLNNNEQQIYMEEYIPDVLHQKVPMVIFSHGFNGSGDDFKRECMILQEKGIASICYDFCNGSLTTRSSGDTTKMSLLTEKKDLITVLEYAKTLSYVDLDQIYLFGGSQGGMVSALVAEEYKDAIAGLMLLYPALCIPEDWQKRFPTVEDIPEIFNELWDVPLGKVYFETIHDWNIWNMIGNYNKPVMIMHGDKDEVVPLDYAKKAANHYPFAYYEEFTSEGHGFTKEGMDRVTQMIETFVKVKKVFQVQVKLTGNKEIDSGMGNKIIFLPFTGLAQGEYFNGVILPGGADTQTVNDTCVHMSARYVLDGTDKNGNECKIFLQNEGSMAQYGITVTKASVTTDSKLLADWNSVGLYGTLTESQDPSFDVTIQFYVKENIFN